MRNLFFNKIELKSFQERNIDPIILDNLSKINLIIAPNGRGKSTLCEALRKLIGYKTMTSKRGSKECIKLSCMNVSGMASINSDNVEFNTNFSDPWNEQLDVLIDKNDRSYILNMEDFITKGEEAFLSTIKNQTTKGLKFENITTNLSTKEHSLTSVEKENLRTYERTVNDNNVSANQIPQKLEIVNNNTKQIKENDEKIKSNEELIFKNKEILFDNQIKKLENKINTDFSLENKLCELKLQNEIDSVIERIDKTNEDIIRLNNEKPKENTIDFDINKDYNTLFNNLNDVNNKHKENIRDIQENNAKLEANHYDNNLKIDETFNIKEISDLFDSVEKLKKEKNELFSEESSDKYSGIKKYLKENENPQMYLERQKDISIENQKEQCELNSLNELSPILNNFLSKCVKVYKKNGIIAGSVAIIVAIISYVMGVNIPSLEAVKMGGLCVGVFGLVILIWGLLATDVYRKGVENFAKKIEDRKNELEKKELSVDLNILKYNYNNYIAYENNQEKISDLFKEINELKEKINAYLIKYGFPEDVSFDYIKNQYEYYKELFDFGGLNNTKERLEKKEEEYKNEWNNLLKDYIEIKYNDEDYSIFISNLKNDYSEFLIYNKWKKDLEKLNDDLKKENEKLFEYFKSLGVNTKEEYNQILERLEDYNIIKKKLDNFTVVKNQGLNKSFDDWSQFDINLKDEEIIKKINELNQENIIIGNKISDLEKEKLLAENFIKEKKELSNEEQLKKIVKLKKEQNNRFNTFLEDHVKSMVNEELLTRSNEYAKEINNRASKLFFEFTKGKYSMIIKENIIIKDNIDNIELSFEQLSKGSQIQLILATRIAMIEQLEEKLGIKLPIFLDEITENSDVERTKEIINTLSNLKDRQIFCFSPKNFAKSEWENALGKDKVNVIELS